MASNRPTKPSHSRNDLRVKEAAYLASVSCDWIYRRLKRIPHKRRGKVIIIARDAFLVMLDQKRMD